MQVHKLFYVLVKASRHVIQYVEFTHDEQPNGQLIWLQVESRELKKYVAIHEVHIIAEVQVKHPILQTVHTG